MSEIYDETKFSTEWKEIFNPITNDIHNVTLSIDENHYVSFLFENNTSVAKSLGLDAATDQPDVGETALCTLSPWSCFILNGDFRKQYEELVDQGYDACYNFFLTQKEEFGSSWSDES